MADRSVLLDPTALASWADGVLPGSGPLTVEPLGDGHSNLTFSVGREGEPAAWVLRRPPAGPLLPTAHDVVREFRVLSLLDEAGTVAVPHVVALCEDASVIGAPFYVMQRTPGVVIRESLPDWLEADVPAQRALGLALVDALADLHGVPWQPFVDAGIGRADGYLERQVRRWTGQREGIQQAVAAAGGRARDLPDYDAVRDWLRANLPQPVAPAVVHGDFKLDNVIVARGEHGPRIAAVVDWEMATVGDPRADVGYLLSYWPEPGREFPLGHVLASGPGFPTPEILVARWSERTGRDAGDLRWFVALAVWKLAILLEASYHRYLAGMSTDPFFRTLDVGVPALLARAREVAGA
jgi:aminoglycoside phosphotransferase (APT) family kinase protein